MSESSGALSRPPWTGGLRMPAARLDEFLGVLNQAGFTVIGPRIKDGAIVYGIVKRSLDLPIGWTDEQAPARYRLHKTAETAMFSFNVGPDSLKRYLFPPREKIFKAVRSGSEFNIEPETAAGEPNYAFLGVRACEIAGLQIQDAVFQGGRFPDPGYVRRRGNALVIAVECTRAGGLCFCDSLKCGPIVDSGYDIAMTEVVEPEHVFVVRVGTEKGRRIVSQMGLDEALPQERDAAVSAVAQAARQMGRTLVPEAPAALQRYPQHPRWSQVAARCLACANCTMVCPTCFCSNVEDVTDLTGDVAERSRVWDSCFTSDHSYLPGGAVRPSIRSRYRQWLTHKLSTWYDQFGMSGCTGCGRCIAWCPAGIDLTEEAAAIASPGPGDGA